MIFWVHIDEIIFLPNLNLLFYFSCNIFESKFRVIDFISIFLYSEYILNFVLGNNILVLYYTHVTIRFSVNSFISSYKICKALRSSEL
jgi:hypothetical protein